MAKKIILIVLGIVFATTIGFGIYWTVSNWDAIKQAMDGTHLYTKEDVDNARQEGIEIGITSKDEYSKLIDQYKDTIAGQNSQISELNNEVIALTETKNQNEATIKTLTSQKEENLTLIATLNAKVKDLNTQIEELKANSGDNEDEIKDLENQISDLEAQIVELETSNASLVSSADALATENENLNNQIKDAQAEILANQTTISELNTRISELEQSIKYYEEYIAGLESDTLVVATFIFDGSVYEMQTLVKGACALDVAPENTDYVTFNYWMVDGVEVDETTYELNQNTTFTANVTYKYDVTFKANNQVHNSQIITENGYAIVPTNPKLTGYEFDGWSLDGINVVDVSTNPITANTTYTAVFTKLFTAVFKYEDNVVDTQSIRYGECAEGVTVEDTEYKTFNGWMIYNNIVDVESYKIYENVEFTASITYSYDVVFMVDGEEFGSEIVTKNGYATMDSEPIKENYTFKGWSIDGTTIVDLSTYKITDNTTFIAIFNSITAGLYDSNTKEMIKTWSELIADDYLVLADDGTLSAGTYATSMTGDLELSNKVTSVSANTFENCSGLNEVIIPDTVTSIGSKAFKSCTGISKLFIPKTVKRTGSYTFDYCNPGLVVYTDASSITVSSIDISAKTFTNSSREIYENANVIVSNGVTYIEDTANEYFGFVKFDGNSNITEIVLDGRLTNLPVQAFYGKNKITSVYIPANIQTIGMESFRGCSKLENVEFANNSACTLIGNDAFLYCSSLKNITLPSNLRTISRRAFGYCTSLETIYIPNSVQMIGDSSFYAFHKCPSTLVIYCGSAEANENWHADWNNLNYLDSTNPGVATVKYGYTVDQYLAEING